LQEERVVEVATQQQKDEAARADAADPAGSVGDGVVVERRCAAPRRRLRSAFGPRGLASVVFGLLLIERGIPQGEALLATVVTTEADSVLLHGLTSVPFVRASFRWYASHAETHPAVAETAPAMMPRHRHQLTAPDVERLLQRQDAE
jgi:hypothetical protein